VIPSDILTCGKTRSIYGRGSTQTFLAVNAGGKLDVLSPLHSNAVCSGKSPPSSLAFWPLSQNLVIEQKMEQANIRKEEERERERERERNFAFGQI
jgi:hypothetical protein